jgi:thiamine biosynthesis lipoprotein
MRRIAAALAATALACAAPPPAAPLVQISEGRPAMGTVLEITVVAASEAHARAALARCFAESERLESIFTTWRDDGELARLNARAGAGPQPASPELLRILADAQQLARETGGAFDVTVGPLLALWRDAERTQARPSDAQIESARSRVGAQRIRLDPRAGTASLEPDMAIDLGGLAKGWTLDRLGELLAAEGIARSLLDFGGSSLRARGVPLDAERWLVASDGGAILALGDEDVSISEADGQGFAIAGERFSHIVDPRTGTPVAGAVRARVHARDGSLAEGWSTALVVLGAEGLRAVPCGRVARAHVANADGERVACASPGAP